MPLRSLAGESTKTSQFYKKHESFALGWEKIGQEFNAEINGSYNEYVVDIDLKIPFESGIMEVKGVRKMVSVSAQVIPMDSKYMEEVVISYSISGNTEKKFKIRKKNFIPPFLLGYQDFIDFPKMMFRSKAEGPLNNFLKNQMFTKTLFDYPYIQVEYSPKRKIFSIRFFEFIQSQDELKNLIQFAQKAIQYIQL